MTTTHEIPAGQHVDLARAVVGLDLTDRRVRLVEQIPGRPLHVTPGPNGEARPLRR